MALINVYKLSGISNSVVGNNNNVCFFSFSACLPVIRPLFYNSNYFISKH